LRIVSGAIATGLARLSNTAPAKDRRDYRAGFLLLTNSAEPQKLVNRPRNPVISGKLGQSSLFTKQVGTGLAG